MKSFLLPDGRSLVYREAGEGPPLILLHGWAMSSAVFQELLTILAGSCRVLVPDLPGHGRSDVPKVLTLSALAEDLGFWITGLNLHSFSLGGWSLGGQLALSLASSSLSLPIHRLLLIATTPCFVAGPDWPVGLPEKEVRAMGRGVRQDFLRTMERFFHLQFEAGELTRDRLREIVRFALPDGSLPEPRIALEGLEILQRTDLRSRLADIALPTLVLHGEMDLIVPAGAGCYLANQLPGARYCEFSGVGHAPFLSRPEAFCDVLSGFLKP